MEALKAHRGGGAEEKPQEGGSPNLQQVAEAFARLKAQIAELDEQKKTLEEALKENMTPGQKIRTSLGEVILEERNTLQDTQRLRKVLEERGLIERVMEPKLVVKEVRNLIKQMPELEDFATFKTSTAMKFVARKLPQVMKG